MPGDYPIAIMSFNRPQYLEPVLQALSAQTHCHMPQRPISLFQDGVVNRITGQPQADPKDVESCIALFRLHFPHGTVFESTENLGVALNFERAEHYAFETLNADAALFFEDDLVVSPFYVHSLEHLLAIAETDDRIG